MATVCNTALPSNAICTGDLEPGMRFVRSHDPSKRVYTTEEVGYRAVLTDHGPVKVSEHGHIGCVYLVGEDAEGYDYHAGHGCVAELKPAVSA